jgi:hypothetical protein
MAYNYKPLKLKPESKEVVSIKLDLKNEVS